MGHCPGAKCLAEAPNGARYQPTVQAGRRCRAAIRSTTPPLNPATARYCGHGKRGPCSRPAGRWRPVQRLAQAEQGSCRYRPQPAGGKTRSEHRSQRQIAALPLGVKLASEQVVRSSGGAECKSVYVYLSSTSPPLENITPRVSSDNEEVFRLQCVMILCV